MELKNQLYCVIMAGGTGSRFWPMSRQSKPKQFLDVLGTGRTLLQQTVDRFSRVIPRENIFIVTNKAYSKLVHEQIPGFDPQQVLLEPSRRNTAPCLGYAAHKIFARNPEALLVVAPSDHLILKEEDFLEQVDKAVEFATHTAAIVTLRIRPSRPDTGYGYIQFNDKTNTPESTVRKVKTFTEKPNLELASSFLSSGDFLWNSGIFITSVSSILSAFQKHLPEIYAVFQDGLNVYYKEEEQPFLERAYAQCTNISIDYGIIEKASNVYVIPSDFGWSDLGTWGSLYENSNKDEAGNVVQGKRVMLYDAKDCLINMPREKLVLIQGLDDFIVVDSDNMLLICRKENEQEIRQMVADVKAIKGEEFI